MRLITGIYKGRRFDIPRTFKARPTTDFAKENIFNVLNGYVDFESCRALDLFSGTGGLGLEAVSRGAAKVFLVERDAGQIAALQTNLATVAKAMPEATGTAQILHADVRQLPGLLPPVCHGSIDLILADPP